MNKYLLAPLAGSLLLVGSTMAAAAAGPMTVQLAPENNSGESGTATLTDNGDGTTTVSITLSAEPAGADQPTHVHSGHCGQPDFNPKPAFPLTDIKGGASTTTIKTDLKSLTAAPFAINSHKSATEITTYVACGNITLAQQSAVVPGAPKTGAGGGAGGSGLPEAGWIAAAAAILAAGGVAARRRLHS